MITIKRTSWHYRLNDIFWEPLELTQNLCRYFWQTVLSTSVSLILVSLLAGLSCKLIYHIIVNINEGILIVIMVLFVLGSIIIPTCVISYFRKYFPPSKTEIPTPNFIAEIVEAKKQKYCPSIEFK